MRAAGPADMMTTRSDSALAPQIEQQVTHDLARLRVERAERLIHQQNLRIADQHLRQPDALALAAGQHVRVAIAERSQADAGQPALRPLARLGRRRTRRLQADGDVFQRGLPGKQRVGLEQVAGLAVERGQFGAEYVGAAGRGRHQPGGDIEQRGFAAAGRPDDGHEFPVGDIERGALDRGIDAAAGQAEGDRNRVQRNGRGLTLRGCALRHAFPRDASNVGANYPGRTCNARCATQGR
jgi:hypothetical protein